MKPFISLSAMLLPTDGNRLSGFPTKKLQSGKVLKCLRFTVNLVLALKRICRKRHNYADEIFIDKVSVLCHFFCIAVILTKRFSLMLWQNKNFVVYEFLHGHN